MAELRKLPKKAFHLCFRNGRIMEQERVRVRVRARARARVCGCVCVCVCVRERERETQTSIIPHFLDKQLTHGDEVVSLKRRPHLAPQEDSWYPFVSS
jgi:hypothetical protein